MSEGNSATAAVHSLNAKEEIVVATLLAEFPNSPLPESLQRLLQNAPESFEDGRYGTVALAIHELRLDNKPVHTVTVCEWLTLKSKLDDAGGALFLDKLSHEAFSLDLAEFEAKEVWRAFSQRRTKSVLADALEQADRHPGATSAIAAGLIATLSELACDSQVKTEARPIGSLVAPSRDDGNELYANRFICRGAGALLVGQSGQGKSSLAMQMAVEGSLNRPCFGIRPTGPLDILMIGSENDDGDMFEMFSGVCAGLKLSEEDKKLAGERIVFFHEDSRAGDDFLRLTVEPLVKKHRPDLLILDPALAFLGADTKDAEAVGSFLRRGLNPILHRYGCAALIIHHTTKAKADGPQSTHDFLYAGSGSIEFTNWARAVLVLETRGNGCYRLHAPKRGKQIGWADADGHPVFDTFIRHSRTPGAICWETVDDAQVEAITRNGKCKADLLAHVPVAGSIPQSVLLEKANASGIGKNKCRAFLDELVSNGTLHLWLAKRKGTNPAKLISRQPQAEPQLANV